MATRLESVNVCGLDVPPPGNGLNTVILNAPAVVRSLAGMADVTCVLLSNVVTLSEPLKRTTEAATKFVPLTVIVKAGSPAVLVAGEMLVVVGSGLFTTNALLIPVAPPPVFVAVMVKLPPLAIVTLLDDNTPDANAGVVPPPDQSVPVDVMSAVPENPVTVFVFVSRAVI